MAREDEEDQGTPGSVTSETGWKLIMLLRLESHKIAMSGGSWSLKSPMDMEPVIDLFFEKSSPISRNIFSICFPACQVNHKFVKLPLVHLAKVFTME